MRHWAPSGRALKTVVLAAMIGLSVLIVVTPLLLAQSVDYRNSDFFSFWLAGRLGLSGVSPYSTPDWIQGHSDAGATWISDETFLYPLPLALVFAPFGLLPLNNAYAAWVVLSTILIIVTLLLVTRPGLGAPWSLALPLLAAAFLFRPTLISILNGQLSVLLLGILAAAVVLLRSHRLVALGLAVSLLLLKPSLGLPIVAISGLWFLTRKWWSAIAGLTLGACLLLLAGMAADPGWVGKYMDISSHKLLATIGYSPTLWGFLGLVLGEASEYFVPAGILSSVLIVSGILVFTRQLPIGGTSDIAFAAIVATGLIVTPYLWAYDLVLLILPVAILASRASKSTTSFLILALALIGFAVASLALIMVAEDLGRDAWSFLLTLAVLIALIRLGAKESVEYRHAARRLAEDP